MSHKCYIEGSSKVCIEFENNLLVKEANVGIIEINTKELEVLSSKDIYKHTMEQEEDEE